MKERERVRVRERERGRERRGERERERGVGRECPVYPRISSRWFHRSSVLAQLLAMSMKQMMH